MNEDFTAAHAREKPIGDEIRDIFRVLVDRWRIVALTTLVTVGLVVLYIWTTTPLFGARVEILIDPRQRQTVESEITPTGLGSSAAGADTLLLESQVEVLRSQKVTDALIKQENLTSDSEFAGAGSFLPVKIVKTLIKMVVYGPQSSLWNTMSPYDRALNTLRERMTVERQRNTYVIAVTVLSSDPQKAARLANRIAEIYIAEINGAASDATREAATILSSKLTKLGRAASETTRAVEIYKRQNNLIDTNDTLVVEQMLNNLNREFSQARSELQATLARRNQLNSALSSEGGEAIDYSQVGESAVMSQLQTRLAEVESREAFLLSAYLDSHPVLIRVRDRKEALKTSMRKEHKRIMNQLDVDYNTALEKSNSLKAEVDQLIAQMATSNSDTVKLHEMEREAETNRALYESFLRRSKQAREQIDIPNSTARVISSAFPASRPKYPAVFLLLASGLALGTVFGLFAAFLSHIFGIQSQPMRSVVKLRSVRRDVPKETAPASILNRMG
jgi:succinoglycan biosynthesis transport protein ExoP